MNIGKHILSLTVIYSMVVLAQYPTRTINVFNFPNNARFVAMGGDAIGSLDGHSAMFDQLQLSDEKFTNSSFSFRPPNWNNSENISFSQVSLFRNLGMNTGYGLNFYTNFSARSIGMGEGSPIFLGNVQEFQMYMQFYYRIELVEDFSIATGFKYYSASNNFITLVFGSPTSGRVDGSAFLADIGAMWKYKLFDQLNNGSLFFLTSLSNFGSQIVYAEDLKYAVPRSFHFEIAYHINYKASHISSLETRLHYRNVLNAHNADNHVFWSIGIEALFWKSIFIRSGMYFTPYSTIFGLKNESNYSYGLGVMLDGKRLRLEAFRLKLDFTIVPVHAELFPHLNITRIKSNYIFTIAIETL